MTLRLVPESESTFPEVGTEVGTEAREGEGRGKGRQTLHVLERKGCREGTCSLSSRMPVALCAQDWGPAGSRCQLPRWLLEAPRSL